MKKAAAIAMIVGVGLCFAIALSPGDQASAAASDCHSNSRPAEPTNCT
jgi:hypothetical protein